MAPAFFLIRCIVVSAKATLRAKHLSWKMKTTVRHTVTASPASIVVPTANAIGVISASSTPTLWLTGAHTSFPPPLLLPALLLTAGFLINVQI
jgi:hypothetical protein